MALILPSFMWSQTEIMHGQRLLSLVMLDARKKAVEGLAYEIERYRAQNGQYPSSLAVMAATPGFEQDRGFITTPGINYSVTTTTDSIWSFSRAVVSGIDLTHSSLTAFLASNTCGSGNFSTASDWCGSSQGSSQVSDWYKAESRSNYMAETAQARRRLNQTFMKFIGNWNVNGYFPAGTLSAGGTASLASLVGTSMTAKTCSGTFNFSGIPLSCEDLFSFWGGNVMYAYINTSQITILAQTPFTFISGKSQYVVSEMQYQNGY